MPTFHYQLTKLAAFDLDGIWKYTCKRWGERQAGTYLRQLKRRVETLARRPLSGKQRDELAGGLLSYHEGRHLIFYRRLAAGGIVIIRVLHDRMDVPARLDEAE